MANIKMVVTDLDATLLRTDKTISEYTKTILTELHKQGILFAIATARPVYAVRDILPWLTYDAAVFHNGGVIYKDDTKVASYGIEHPHEIITSMFADNPSLHLTVAANDTLYANFDVKQIWPFTPYIFTEDFAELKDVIAEKLLVKASNHEEMEYYRRYINDDLYMQLSENVVAMIMNKKATKLNGIKKLTNIYGIDLDEVVTFGDDYSDIEMIKACGKGIAMENALDIVKESADDICMNNDEDGVARWIEKNLL